MTVIDPMASVREKYGDEVAERTKTIIDYVKSQTEKPMLPGQTFNIDPRPIFVILTTTAFLWGKDPRQVNTGDVYAKVIDLMNMFFQDK